MSWLRGFGPLLVAGALAIATIWFVAEPVAQWITKKITTAPKLGAPIGKLLLVQGKVKRIQNGEVEESQNNVALELFDGDRIETTAASRALLVLQSQDELELQPLSSASLQLWHPGDSLSPIYVTLIAGDVESRRTGVPGKAYVVRDGRLYLPHQKKQSKPMALTVLRSAPLDMQLPSADSGSDFAKDDSQGETDEKPEKDNQAEPETLANEYIDETIGSRQGLLQKCWLTRLNEQPNLKGQLLVQFAITRRGKVKDVKIADSTINDEPLQKCVTTVFERLAFKSFRGPEISLSYPINFE
jgi:hypothetical protein